MNKPIEKPKINDANKRIKSTEGKVDNVNKRISDTESSMKSKLASAVSSLNKNIDAANEKSKKHGIRRKEEIKTFRKEQNDKIRLKIAIIKLTATNNIIKLTNNLTTFIIYIYPQINLY